MSIIKHEIITHIPIVLAVPNIIKFRTISPSCHLEHTEKKPIVEASNNNGLKLAKHLKALSNNTLYTTFNEPICIVLQHNGAKETCA